MAAAATSSSTAATPSSHQWLAVATTAKQVITGWASTNHRQRLVLAVITTSATSTAHPTCTEGMADSWSDAPRPRAVYTDCP
jgi:hypothetical protein